MKPDKELVNRLVELRKKLHQFPELSGNEKVTSKTILDFISSAKPDEIITNIGGYGLAAIFDSKKEGPAVLIRADLDALPIPESNTFKHKSKTEGVAHLCGHDGHMSILAGLAQLLHKSKPQKGKAILLFQPAEETGQGAALVLKDKKFTKLKYDYAFAFHNLPGFETGTICIKKGSFASASSGIIITLKGLSSHAAHPEDGNNPDKTIAKLIMGMNKISSAKEKFKDFTLLTVIHANLGSRAFGTTPGSGVVMATLRTYLNEDMEILKTEVENLVSAVCKEHKIKYNISYTEEFPATVNDEECANIVEKTAESLKIPLHILTNAFRWSEDFGHFTQNGKGALFGIGSGKKHPQLHNEDYDFPDTIIEPGLMIFEGIIRSLLNE